MTRLADVICWDRIPPRRVIRHRAADATPMEADPSGPHDAWEVGDEPLIAVDADWPTRGLHAPGEEVSWSVLPERTCVLPPSATGG